MPKETFPITLERLGPSPRQVRIYNATSRSRKDAKHRVVLNLETGACSCSCERFYFGCRIKAARLGREITLSTTDLHCPHITEAIHDCEAAGEIRRAIITPFAELAEVAA